MADDDNEMPEVVARHTIHRRNGKKFEDVSPGTLFQPLNEEELISLRAANAIFESPEEMEMHRRAVQGVISRPAKKGIKTRDVPHAALRAEAAHAADERLLDNLGGGTSGDTGGTMADTGQGETVAETQPAGNDLGPVAARRAARRPASAPVV